MYKNQTKTGYSLIEVMIAVAVLMLAIVAPMTIAMKSIQSSQYTLQQNTATFLAQEAISIVETLRNHQALGNISDGITEGIAYWDWVGNFSDCESVNGCNFDASDPYSLVAVTCDDPEDCRLYYDPSGSRSKYSIDSGSGEPSPFIRQVFFEVSGDELSVRVEVSWDSGFLGQEQTVTMSSSFYNMYGAIMSDS